MTPQRDQPLAPRTSMRVGGPAEFLLTVQQPAEVPAAIAWAHTRGLSLTLLGGGSNVVISDAGVPGVVLDVAIGGQRAHVRGSHVEIEVGAGVLWDDFVADCVARGWAGLECLSGIPGRVGATPIQNVGAYGQEVADTLLSIEVYDTSTSQLARLDRNECGFGYRTSRLKRDPDRFIVLSASFRLEAGAPARLAYPELQKQFDGRSTEPDLARVREAVLQTRRSKSMVLDDADENARSCGSFFLNPELTAVELDQLKSRTSSPPPAFAQPHGAFKVAAAWLIEQAGLRRGQRFGAVGISSRHALALICHDGATARAVVEAAHRVRDTVAQRLGVWLKPEPRFLGFGVGADELPPI